MAKEILIAGSGKAEREEFQKIFEPTGYRLVFSEKGDDVLLKVKQLKPDLIIAGSSELCEAIKRDPGSRDIPFILLSSIFDETPEGGRRRVPADGILSKPFYEDEVLNLVDRLTEKRGNEWEEEEIIELVDVIEEPEPRMSIDDFVGPDKEEPLGEILPLESWGRAEEGEERPLETRFGPTAGKGEEDLLKKEKEGVPEEAVSEGDFFEKIELDEILQKVDDLKPLFEKEWPEEIELKVQPLHSGKPEVPTPPVEIPVEEMDLEALGQEALEAGPKEELSEEEFPEELLEEIIQEEEIGFAEGPEETGLKPEEIKRKPEEMRLETGKIRSKFEEERPMRVIEEEVPREMEKVISEGIREITEEFITKLVPQMTQNIITLTVERIEKMVREIVPDLAEKAIQEEIKRLQKDIKD